MCSDCKTHRTFLQTLFKGRSLRFHKTNWIFTAFYLIFSFFLSNCKFQAYTPKSFSSTTTNPLPNPPNTNPPPTKLSLEIIDKPGNSTSQTLARFTFTSSNAQSIQCRINNKPFESCTSPKVYKNLANGEHTFYIKAINTQNNQKISVNYTWTIDKSIIAGFWGSTLPAILPSEKRHEWIEEVSRQSVNTIFVTGKDNQRILSLVKKADKYGKKSVINLDHTLWNQGQSGLLLLKDYKKRFDDLWNELKPYHNKINGFYLFDEPFHNNTSEKFPVEHEWEIVKDGLNSASKYIQEITGLPTLITFASPTVSDENFGKMLPRKINSIGVNCYKQMGKVCSEEAISDMIDVLKSSKSPSQKLMFTMDGLGYSFLDLDPERLKKCRGLDTIEDSDLKKRNLFWHRLIGDNADEVGAIMPFLYQDLPKRECGMLGYKSYPKALAVANHAMDAWMGLKKCYGNNLYSSDNTLIEANSPYCKPNCEGKDSVRRNAKGQEIDRWLNAPHCGTMI